MGDSDGVALVKKMDGLLSTQFSDVAVFQDEAIAAFQQVLMEALSHVQVLERYIALHIPQMEDGNNFGVTVQLTISKALKEVKDSLVKKMDTVPAYYSSRADLVDKFGLSKTVVSETKTTSKSNVKGGKEGDESKESNTIVSEEKSTGNAVVDLDNK